MESADTIAITICEAIHDSSSDILLLIDDVHELAVDSAPSRSLETLVRNLPPTAHLVLASRTKLPFSIERLRGHGQVLQLAASDLALTQDEIAEILLARGLDPDSYVHPLHSLTGGWPVAVMLSVDRLSSAPEQKVPEAISALTNPHAPLVSYLAEEVISAESLETREIVRIASAIDSFNAGLLEDLGFPSEPLHMLVSMPQVMGLRNLQVAAA